MPLNSSEVANINDRLANMPEPVGITLAALALLDPAIRAVRKAYGTYKLTKLFGEHYVAVQRKIDGEQGVLEAALDTDLACMPKSDVISNINGHLGNLREHFQACQDIVAKIDGHTGRFSEMTCN